MKSDEADQIGLAPPASAIQEIANTSAPAGGQGFSLNAQGHVPIVAKDGHWTAEYVVVSHDFPSLAVGAGTTQTITLPVGSAAVGDLIMLIGVARAEAQFLTWIVSTPIITTADRVDVGAHNADDAGRDLAESNFHFLVIHRHL